MSLSDRRVLVTLATTLFIGIALGRCGTGTTEDRVVYVDRPAPTVTVSTPVLPEICARALTVAVSIRDEAGKVDTAAAPQADLMERAQVAIVNKDIMALNKLAAEQRKLRANTLGSATVLQGDLYNYADILDRCNEELGR